MSKDIYSTDNKLLAQKITGARQKLNLTQTQVAKLLNTTQSYISKVEAGQIKLTVIFLKKISKIYKLDIKSFLNN